jgi:hypothetical protein
VRRPLKFVHTVATAALVGALALQLIIAFRYNPALAANDATALGARAVLVEVTRWVMGPALVICVVSGLLLMGLNKTFASAGWVWAKALLGLMLVKGVITIQDPAVHELYALATQGIAGNPDALAELARLTRMEWLGGWLALALAIAAIAFGVWRPRFASAAQARRSRDDAANDGTAGEPAVAPSGVLARRGSAAVVARDRASD